MIHSARAAPALAHMAEADPAIAALALWCAHRDGRAQTQTAGQTILYGEDFVALDAPRQVGLAAHHVLHVALRHGARGAALRERLGTAFEADLYGLAADAVVNEALILAGHALPRPFVRLTELLDSIGRRAPSAHQALSDWDVERLALSLHHDSATGRNARAYAERQGFAPDLSDGEMGPDDAGETEADWRGHLARAMEAGRRAGTGIGSLAAVIADLAPPRVPWETRLRGLLARALLRAPQQSYRRPSGRWLAMEADARRTARPTPVFQPGTVRDSVRPRIVIGLDTSSSVAPQTLSLFGAEIAAIAAQTGAETHVLAFDEAVYLHQILDPGRRDALRQLDLRSGGGTDFAPVFDAALALSPSAIVLLTDLDAPVPRVTTRAPIFWAVPEAAPKTPPLGTVIEIPRA